MSDQGTDDDVSDKLCWPDQEIVSLEERDELLAREWRHDRNSPTER